MKIKFLIVVVLYKTKLQESTTITTLSKYILPDIKLVIWDNSPSALSDVDIEKLNKMFSVMEYQHTPENISLSKIYNFVFRNNLQYDFFLIFDQDSSLTADYFIKLQEAIIQFPDINLFLPLIYNKNQIVSPGDFFICKGKYWENKHTGLVVARNRLAIASGMAIRISYLENIVKPFDERLKLYGIDSQFILEYGKRNKYFYVLDYVLDHHLSVFTEESPYLKAKRFIDHKHSLKVICKSKSVLSWIIVSIILFTTSILLAIKLKKINVIFD
jgi:GT2 family glycosyltransferase